MVFSYPSRKLTTLDSDLLRAEVEINPYQTIEELSNTLNQPLSAIQYHWIGKVSRASVLVPYDVFQENKINQSITCNLLLQRHNAGAYFDHLIIGDEK